MGLRMIDQPARPRGLRRLGHRDLDRARLVAGQVEQPLPAQPRPGTPDQRGHVAELGAPDAGRDDDVLGLDVALVGRWFLGLTRGRLAHTDILAAPSLPREAGLGWTFHFLIGGGGVALVYPAVLLAIGMPSPAHPILGGLLFGLLTSLLPWFVLLPAFGWGRFGRRGPPGTNALLASPLSHVPYGLGVGAVMALGTWFP